MPLAHGRKILAIPGPTTVPDEVIQAMARPMVDIFEGELSGMTESILDDVRFAFRSEQGQVSAYVANGHGAWEAAIANVFSRGDKVLALESGFFAVGWAEMARRMGVEVEIIPGRPRAGVDYDALEARLNADDRREIKAVLVVQIDTSSSVANDIPRVRAAIDATGHPALFCVDCVASLGCMRFEFDAWRVDLALAASQKGLMAPPGMSFTIAGPRALDAHESADLRTAYWDWTSRLGSVHYQKYCGTPPEPQIFALRRSLDMLLDEEGLERAWARHAALAEATHRCVERWAAGGAPLELHVPTAEERAPSVTLVRTPSAEEADSLRAAVLDICGVTLGVAFDSQVRSQGGFRIAHMGHVNAATHLGVLGSIETSMRALGWAGAEGGVSEATRALGDAARRLKQADAEAAGEPRRRRAS